MELTSKEIKQFQTKILMWYHLNKRDLPWRKTRDPYKILVSEVMLQQTQVSRVISKYDEWLNAFPDIETLAKASVSDVLTHWMGLGYNRRALYLKKCAEEVVRFGAWPRTEKELMKLPGIGKYTARALLCFAFGEEVSVVDTNVRRVILTQFEIPNHKSQVPSEKLIQEMADQLLPHGKARDWNQALMDYASAVLKKEKIPIPKQSKYLGSDRYYRAKILKLLLIEKKVSMASLGTKIKESFTSQDRVWLAKIVTSLEKDGLVKVKKLVVSLE